jgi:asparagine N-glycosylation enzyme membrane subunit Stt3
MELDWFSNIKNKTTVMKMLNLYRFSNLLTYDSKNKVLKISVEKVLKCIGNQEIEQIFCDQQIKTEELNEYLNRFSDILKE